MSAFTRGQLADILGLHLKYLCTDDGGKRADLCEADLRGANLGGADLSLANLGDLHIIQIGPVGSRNDYLIVQWGKDPDGSDVDRVQCGCFTGTLAEFAAAVEQTHGQNQHGRDYRAAVVLVRSMQSAEVPS